MIQNILLFIGTIIFLFALYSIFISIKENEITAAKRLSLLMFPSALPFIILSQFNSTSSNIISIVLISIVLIFVLIYLIPLKGKKHSIEYDSKKKIDERDVMFSRNLLKENTNRYDDYYNANPNLKELDDQFRTKPGLLNKDATFYDALTFNSSNASFYTVETLAPFIDGKVNNEQSKIDDSKISNYLKSWSKKLGALECGFTELQPHHLYSHKGRGENYGKEISLNHKYAIAFTVEMDKFMLDAAPTGTIVMESAQQYLSAGMIAIQMAEFIRQLGYEAKAHIDGNYDVVCPLVARDAGLGEIGRMGLLMTPKLGPRVRIAVVTTNLPLVIDEQKNFNDMIDFCIHCKKCSDVCPSNAISNEDRKEIDGVKRWQINSEKCFTLWCSFGTDCGRCVSVCPYSHPDNFFHNIVRFGISNSFIFRRIAIVLDDLIYGRTPITKEAPKWISKNRI